MEEKTLERQEAPEIQEVKPEPVQNRRSRFVEADDDAIKTIDLGGGDWVKVSKKIPYERIAALQAQTISQEDKAKMAVAITATAILEWNLVDASGNIAPITVENVAKLELEAITPILQELQEATTIPKGNSAPSVGQ